MRKEPGNVEMNRETPTRLRTPYIALQIPTHRMARTSLRRRRAATARAIRPMTTKVVPVQISIIWPRSTARASTSGLIADFQIQRSRGCGPSCTTLHEEVVDGQCVVDSWRVSKNSKPFDSTLSVSYTHLTLPT